MATPHIAVSFTAMPNTLAGPDLVRELNRRFAVLQKALSPVVGTFGDGNTTPSVAASSVWRTANTGSTSITEFINGLPEQTIVLIAGDTNTTLVQNPTLLILTAGSNLTLTLGQVVSFVTVDGTVWRQVS